MSSQVYIEPVFPEPSRRLTYILFLEGADIGNVDKHATVCSLQFAVCGLQFVACSLRLAFPSGKLQGLKYNCPCAS